MMRLVECNESTLKDDYNFNLGRLLLDKKTLKATYNNIIVFDSEDIKDRMKGLELQIEKLEKKIENKDTTKNVFSMDLVFDFNHESCATIFLNKENIQNEIDKWLNDPRYNYNVKSMTITNL